MAISMTTPTQSNALPRTPGAPPPMQMMEMLYGALATQLISVAAEYGIADLLCEGPRPVADLAAGSGTHPGALYRVLRALAGLGVFAEVAPGVFGLTPLAETLRGGVSGSMKEIAQDVGGRTRLLAYAELSHSLRTGQPAFDHAHGMGMWPYLRDHPDEVALFSRAMGNLASQAHSAAFAVHDLSDVRCLVDVGGGEGHLVAAVLPRYPDLRAIVFDEPHVTRGADRVLADAGLTGRVDIVGGNVFEAVPEGGDAYVLSSILFSYEDEDAGTILTNIRRVLTSNGRVLVLEPVLSTGNDPHPGKLLDVCQLALHRGGVRTETEWLALLDSAGFRLAEMKRMWPSSPTDLIVAVPA
ncbi:MAG TPA: methyltransferase [Mycobacteriales bacterium]|nr:methyltransferase [Mycobacteriales bacterium]